MAEFYDLILHEHVQDVRITAMVRTAALIFVLLTTSIAEAGRYVGITQRGLLRSGTLIVLNHRAYVLTAAHDLDEKQPAGVFAIQQQRLNPVDGNVVAIDRARDLAIVEYNARLTSRDVPAPLAEESPTAGTVKFVGYGNRRYTERSTRLIEPVTTEIKYQTTSAVRTLPRIDATSKPGDSGGAIMHDGHLIGVLLGSLEGTHDGMFVPVEEVHEFLKEHDLE